MKFVLIITSLFVTFFLVRSPSLVVKEWGSSLFVGGFGLIVVVMGGPEEKYFSGCKSVTVHS